MNENHLLNKLVLTPLIQDYNASHRARISQHLPSNYQFKQAAVLIPLVKRPQGWQVILTQRAHHLKHHPGQIAFPGGRFEPEDGDLMTTALRETKEETGIGCTKGQILGRLPALETVSGYRVTPFFSTVMENYQVKIDPNEVAEIFEVPIKFLLNPVNIKSQKSLIKGEYHTIYAIPFSHYSIWGATAQMIKLLSDQIWD